MPHSLSHLKETMQQCNVLRTMPHTFVAMGAEKLQEFRQNQPGFARSSRVQNERTP
jgi:hypothetical protein